MKRRDFLQLLSASGMACVAPIGISKANAACEPDQFLVTIFAKGGWDSTSFCDPKGNAERSDGNGPVNTYRTEDIGRIGNFLYAPDLVGYESKGLGEKSKAFFEKHYQNMTVINGFDSMAPGHVVDSAASGNSKGYPSLCALFAATHQPESSTGYISFGGYNKTRGLVPLCKVEGGVDFDKMLSQSPIKSHSPDVYDLLNNHKANREDRLMQQETLPARRASMGALFNISNNDEQLATLQNFLPDRLDDGLSGQAELAIAMFASGMSISADLILDGFDTHGSNDQHQSELLGKILDAVDVLSTRAERFGIADKLNIYICSEWTRTPFYNDQSMGKDDYGIGSAVIISPQNRKKNTRIQATDDEVNILKVNPTTLQVDEGGSEITQHHVHRSLRDMLCISPVLQEAYPLPVDHEMLLC